MGFHWTLETFQKSQYLLIVIILAAAWFGFRSRGPKTQFRNREADRTDLNRLRGSGDLANAKISRHGGNAEPKAPPLSLPGIRLHGAPHEVLGIRETASEAEILRAYKEAIKQYHPDRIQGPAQEQMKFYQEAAAQLNRAKEMMLQKVRKPS